MHETKAYWTVYTENQSIEDGRAEVGARRSGSPVAADRKNHSDACFRSIVPGREPSPSTINPAEWRYSKFRHAVAVHLRTRFIGDYLEPFPGKVANARGFYRPG